MVMDMVLDIHTMDTMDTHMLIMDITMARDLLMLMPVLMLTMVPMDMVLLTMDTHMLAMDTTTARDPLMLRLMPMLTTDTDTTLMATMDTMDTHAYGYYGHH